MDAKELKSLAARLMGCEPNEILRTSDPALDADGNMRVLMTNGQKFIFTAAEIVAGGEHVVYATMYRNAIGRFVAADQQDVDGEPEVIAHTAKSVKKPKRGKGGAD